MSAARLGPCWLLAACAACSAPDGDTGAVDVGEPAEALDLPDLTGLDFTVLVEEALLAALTVDAGTAWAGHRASLERRSDGCPDFYAGVPDVEGTEAQPDDPGISWYDHCAGTDADFDGIAYWETDLTAQGDADAGEEVLVEAVRTLEGDALVSQDNTALFSFDGTATDTLYSATSEGYTRWVWSSEVAGSVLGSDALADDAPFPGGWRTDLYAYATGGDSQTIELRGNVYLYGDSVAERFDSMAMDLELLGTGAAGPDDCELEPYGWVGLRDTDAWWYDVVFLPRDDDDATDDAYGNEPYGACDGCGTLYVRGLEVVEVGEVCVDLSSLWAAAEARLPTAADYVLSLRDLEAP